MNNTLQLFRVLSEKTYIGTDGKEHRYITFYLVSGSLIEPITGKKFGVDDKRRSLLSLFPAVTLDANQWASVRASIREGENLDF